MQNAPPVIVPLADATAQTATTLALLYRLDGTPALHGGLLQALTLTVAEHLNVQLRHDGTLYRDGKPAGRITLELTAQDDASLARLTAPLADGLAAALLALLAEWNDRPYLPVANRWTEFALDGDIDQKGRRIEIHGDKPVFID